MTFAQAKTATIRAKITPANEFRFFNGVTTAAITPDIAASQINKILSVADQAISVVGMTRIITEEAVDNG